MILIDKDIVLSIGLRLISYKDKYNDTDKLY